MEYNSNDTTTTTNNNDSTIFWDILQFNWSIKDLSKFIIVILGDIYVRIQKLNVFSFKVEIYSQVKKLKINNYSDERLLF